MKQWLSLLGKNMRKIFFFILFFTSSFIFFLLKFVTITYAAPPECNIIYFKDDKGELNKNEIPSSSQYIEYAIKADTKNVKYTVYTDDGHDILGGTDYKKTGLTSGGVRIEGRIEKNSKAVFEPKSHTITVELEGVPDNAKYYCQSTYKVIESLTPALQEAQCLLEISSEKDPDNSLTFTPSTKITVTGNAFPTNFTTPDLQFGNYPIKVTNLKTGEVNSYSAYYKDKKRPSTDKFTNVIYFDSNLFYLREGEYKVETQDIWIRDILVGANNKEYTAFSTLLKCAKKFIISSNGGGEIIPTPTITPTSTPTPSITPTPPDFCRDNDSECNSFPINCSGRCKICYQCQPTHAPISRVKPVISIPDLKPLCDQLTTENSYRDKCWTCQKTGGIWSAIGCLPTDFSALINKYVFTTGIGIAGGIAFLYFLYGAFMILTSSGNAEKMEEAKQIITSSLAGLLLIIFSIFLLKTIGVDILQLPGFK